jgi:hypothetical protein
MRLPRFLSHRGDAGSEAGPPAPDISLRSRLRKATAVMAGVAVFGAGCADYKNSPDTISDIVTPGDEDAEGSEGAVGTTEAEETKEITEDEENYTEPVQEAPEANGEHQYLEGCEYRTEVEPYLPDLYPFMYENLPDVSEGDPVFRASNVLIVPNTVGEYLYGRGAIVKDERAKDERSYGILTAKHVIDPIGEHQISIEGDEINLVGGEPAHCYEASLNFRIAGADTYSVSYSLADMYFSRGTDQAFVDSDYREHVVLITLPDSIQLEMQRLEQEGYIEPLTLGPISDPLGDNEVIELERPNPYGGGYEAYTCYRYLPAMGTQDLSVECVPDVFSGTIIENIEQLSESGVENIPIGWLYSEQLFQSLDTDIELPHGVLSCAGMSGLPLSAQNRTHVAGLFYARGGGPDTTDGGILGPLLSRIVDSEGNAVEVDPTECTVNGLVLLPSADGGWITLPSPEPAQ